MRPSDVCIGSLIRNCEWVLPDFLKRIERLDYPKSSLDLLFVVNDSSDRSFELLSSFAEEKRRVYRKIVVARHDLGEQAIGAGSSRLGSHDPLGRQSNGGATDRLRLFHNLAHLRNVMVELYLGRSGAEWLFSIDSDVLVPQDSLVKLIGEGEPKLAGAMVVNDLVNNPEKRYDLFHRRCNAGVLVHGSPEFAATTCLGHKLNYRLGEVYDVAVTGACFVLHRDVAPLSSYCFHEWGEDAGYCLGLPAGTKIQWNTGVVCTHAMSLDLLKDAAGFEASVKEAEALCRRLPS